SPACMPIVRLSPSWAARHACPGASEVSQVPYKGRLHVHGVSDCARLLVRKPFARRGCCFPANRTASAPRNSTRFAAQYPARGLPCERFKLSLAASPCITRGRGGWLGEKRMVRRTMMHHPKLTLDAAQLATQRVPPGTSGNGGTASTDQMSINAVAF